MKKKIFIIIWLFVILDFLPEVSALPLFSRQTGMACSACHFQHFPILNGFGRAFKSAGYTMMGAQGKVEGEGLSIPNTLNMNMLVSSGYEKSNQVGSVTPAKNTDDGAFYLPGSGGKLSLFGGGRVSGNAGFLAELEANAPATGIISSRGSSAKLPIFFEVENFPFKTEEGTRVGVVPFASDTRGVSYGFELLSTGANVVQQTNSASGLNSAHSTVMSAQQYLGTAGSAAGVAFVMNNPMGFVNLTKYAQTGLTGGNMASLGSTYLRIAGLFDWGGWDAGGGIQIWSGNSASTGFSKFVDTSATALDGQLQGKMADLPIGVYASFAIAPGGMNAYNVDPIGLKTAGAPTPVFGAATKSALNIVAEVGVIPEKVTLGAALRLGKSGIAVGGTNNASDNAISFLATYRLAQNILTSFVYTNATGDYWDAAHQDALGSVTTTMDLLATF